MFRSPGSPIWSGDVGGKAGGNLGISRSALGMVAGDRGGRGDVAPSGRSVEPAAG
jgi:hypothetical protein